MSIDTGGHQNIVKIELEIYFSDLSSSNVLPFECKFSNAAPEGMSLTKIGAGKYKALINLGDREPESVMSEFFEKFAYSPSEDLAGDFKVHINIRNKNATNDWSYSKASEFDLSVTPIAEVPVAEIEALSDLNHDGKADNHQKFYVNKDVLLEFTVKAADLDGSEQLNSVFLSGLKDASGQMRGSIVDISGNPVGTLNSSGEVEFSEEEIEKFHHCKLKPCSLF